MFTHLTEFLLLMPYTFQNREGAGEVLASLLSSYAHTPSVLYALPRGGVIVASEIAKALRVPLDLVITRKVCRPESPEYAIAAVSESGETILNRNETQLVSEAWFDAEVEKERAEALRRREAYLGGRGRISAKGKNAIIVDDGVATGLSILLAIREIKKDIPWKTIVAVPVCSLRAANEIRRESDEFICPHIEEVFAGSVGAYYKDFAQVEDRDVMDILRVPTYPTL